MKIEEAEKEVLKIHEVKSSLDNLDQELQELKKEFVKEDKQAEAKRIWILQTIIKIHSDFRDVYKLLKSKEYYEGWRKLEQIEIILSSLKKHFSYDENSYKLWQIEKAVKNLQVIFPYRLFASSEILKKKKKCSVCDKEISIRKPCGHIVGEIYTGKCAIE